MNTKAKAATSGGKEKCCESKELQILIPKLLLMTILTAMLWKVVAIPQYIKILLVLCQVELIVAKPIVDRFFPSLSHQCKKPSGTHWIPILIAYITFIAITRTSFPSETAGILSLIHKGPLITKELVRRALAPSFFVFSINATGILAYKVLYGGYSMLICLAIASGIVSYSVTLALGTLSILPSLIQAYRIINLTSPTTPALLIVTAFIGTLWFFVYKNAAAMFKECIGCCCDKK